MEGLAIVGVVSSIVQLVDFSANLVSKTTELYKTGGVASIGAPAMEAAAADLRVLAAKLQGDAKLAGDPQFENLCKLCEDIVTKLLTGLKDVSTNTKQRMWPSIRKALKSIWNNAGFEDLDRRLAVIREELNLRISVDIRDQVGQLSLKTSDQLTCLDTTSKSILEAIQTHKDVFTVQFQMQLALMDILCRQDQHASATDQEKQLAKLPNVPEAAFNSLERRHEPLCLHETRVELLRMIEKWIATPDERHIFWLSGLAGTGKTTISSTAAQYHGHFTASFFFSRGGGDRGHARKLFTSIAVQLADRSPILKQYIVDAVKECSNISSLSLYDQWRYLVLTPLSRLERGFRGLSLLIVLDALDECGDEKDMKTIIQLLAEARSVRTCRVRILVTSRPDIPIRNGFCDIASGVHRNCVLHDVSRAEIDHDIELYLEHNFDIIRKDRGLPKHWPGSKVIQMLVRKSSGLFIWAATACRFVRDGKRFAEKRLSTVLKGGNPDIAPESKLDNIYLAVLSNCISDGFDEVEKKETYALLGDILGSLVVLNAPLSPKSLGNLLDIPAGDILVSLEELHAILDIPASGDFDSSIRLHHPSFRDFLLRKGRCRDERFLVNETGAHTLLAHRCVQLMSVVLKRDICCFDRPGIETMEITPAKVLSHLPREVQYACAHWVSHLQASDIKPEDDDFVHDFLRQHLLHWFEALSLIGKVSEGVLALISLEVGISCRRNPKLHAFVYGAKRFALNNRSIIEQAPLQTYYAALVFAPEQGVIRKQFRKEQPSSIVEMPQTPPHSGPNIHTLEGHGNWVRTIAFSPDGKVVASGAADKTIKLWDTATGATLQTLEGHSDWVYGVAFSTDGTLASGSSDKTVRLWDLSSGSLISVLEGHTQGIRAVSFGKDAELLASGSVDMTVRIWNTKSGEVLQILQGHTQWIYSVAFSLNGTLASASADRTVKIWDPISGVLLQDIEGYTSAVRDVAFSSDGKLMASVTSDQSVWLWDNQYGEGALSQLEGHTDWVYGVAVSPNGDLVASVSADRTVKLWDTASQRLTTTLQGHTDWLFAVAFSPDGRLLASGGSDKCIKIWDMKEANAPVLQGHATPVHAVAVSSDGKMLASAADDDNTVKLWKARSGSSALTLEGHKDWIFALAFSPNDSLLASTSDDQTIRLWDTHSGVLIRLLEGHERGIRGVSFSSDGDILASASDDHTVRLWDARQVTPFITTTKTIKGHAGYVRAVAFSPDNRTIATSSDDKVIMLWDVRTDVPRQIGLLRAHHCSVRAVAFSPDGLLLASASVDGAVNVWDIATQKILQTLRVRVYINALAFSLEGPYLSTNRGLLNIDCYKPERSPHQRHVSPPEVFLDEHWISRKGENVLWLPPQYRPMCSVFQRNTFVFGLSHGLVSCIEFR